MLYQVKKERNVINFLLIFITLGLFSFQSKENSKNDDYDILNVLILKNQKDKICLNSSNDNEYVISIFEEWKLANEMGINELENFYKEKGIYDKENYKQIFNFQELDNFISQKEKSQWKISNKTIDLCIDSNTKNQNKFFISKPVYTIDKNFALVCISKGKNSFIEILRKNKNEWIEYKSFGFILF